MYINITFGALWNLHFFSKFSFQSSNFYVHYGPNQCSLHEFTFGFSIRCLTLFTKAPRNLPLCCVFSNIFLAIMNTKHCSAVNTRHFLTLYTLTPVTIVCCSLLIWMGNSLMCCESPLSIQRTWHLRWLRAHIHTGLVSIPSPNDRRARVCNIVYTKIRVRSMCSSDNNVFFGITFLFKCCDGDSLFRKIANMKSGKNQIYG